MKIITSAIIFWLETQMLQFIAIKREITQAKSFKHILKTK